MSIAPSVIIYDLAFKKVAYLENATNVAYSKLMNQVWTASFRLPANDGKTSFCIDYYYAEIYDGSVRVGLFRIMSHDAVVMEELYYKEYKCEHVLGKLLDDVIFGYIQTASGLLTDDVIKQILTYQTTENWILNPSGTDFTRLFQYELENTNLLSALFSVPKSFDGLDTEYMWTFDDSVYPWLLNLERLDDYSAAKIGIYYRKNLSQITRFRDQRSVITRIYPLGYAEGENQLNVTSVNPTGLEYIDADTISDYGVISCIWVDRRYKDANSLYSAACQHLEKQKIPSVTYTATAADLVSLTGVNSDLFVLGAAVQIRDDDINVNISNRIIEITKPDCVNEPQTVDIKISNLSDSIVDEISNLNGRQIIDETVSQGVLNFCPFTISQIQIQEDFPVRYHVWMPDDDTKTVTLNKAKLILYGYPYRTYSTIANDGYIDADSFNTRQYIPVTAIDIPVSTAEFIDVAESTIINVASMAIHVDITIYPKIPIETNFYSDLFFRLLIRDDPVTGFSAEYYPNLNGNQYPVYKNTTLNHTHVVPSHKHHMQLVGSWDYYHTRIDVVGDTWCFPYVMGSVQSCSSGFPTYEALCSDTTCSPIRLHFVIYGNYTGKKIVFQARSEPDITVSMFAEMMVMPLSKIEVTPEIAEPVDPLTGECYYPSNIEVYMGETEDDLAIVADYATDTNLVGGDAFESDEIDITDKLSKGHNIIEIRCTGKGSIFGQGQISFFQTTHG